MVFWFCKEIIFKTLIRFIQKVIFTEMVNKFLNAFLSSCGLFRKKSHQIFKPRNGACLVLKGKPSYFQPFSKLQRVVWLQKRIYKRDFRLGNCYWEPYQDKVVKTWLSIVTTFEWIYLPRDHKCEMHGNLANSFKKSQNIGRNKTENFSVYKHSKN